ncbi:hypothetical protein LNJ03_11225 [Tenacibaculum dicentrarchi]|nr:hypothetical protein [Tenacibaculum dicentrarchi]
MIKITCNDIELNIVKASLSIVLKNTAFSDNFSLEYSQYPFLILEDKSTEQALGTRHILSLKKQREYDVLVHRNNSVYFGKLKVKSYGVGVRKCDLVFGSELLKILDKPIADFMPNVYLVGNSDYKEVVLDKSGQQNIVDELNNIQYGKYPVSQFQFPEIYAPDFHDKEANDAEWGSYGGYLNNRFSYFKDLDDSNSTEYLMFNNMKEGVPNNRNSFHPCPYLLAPLDNCLNNIDFKRKLISDDFLNNILLFSDVDSHSKYTYSQLKFNIQTKDSYDKMASSETPEYSGVSMLFLPDWSDSSTEKLGGLDSSIYSTNGEIGIRYHFEEVTEATHNFGLGTDGKEFPILRIYFNDSTPVVEKYWHDADSNGVISGEAIYPVSREAELDDRWLNINTSFPNKSTDYSIDVFSTNDKDLYVLSETVDLSRHVPKWTFGEYLNNIKKLLNLKIDVDDSLKTLSFEYIDKYLNNTEMVDLSGYNLEISNYENNQSNGFKIKYANDEFARIDENGVSDEDKIGDDLIEIANDFLTPEFNGTHHEITKDDISDGTILMLNKAGTPNTTDIIENKTLNLVGDKGIGNIFWKDWVKFRQNASNITLTGRIEKKHRIEIQQKKKVYYNNIVFLVEKITLKKKLDFVETTLKVQSKVF